MNSQAVPGEPQAVRRSADRSLSLERNSMTNKRPRRHRNYVSSRSSTHAFQASQLFRNCTLASSKVATLSQRVIGQVMVNDQNQRKVIGTTARLIDPADRPSPL
jgi:capsid protein